MEDVSTIFLSHSSADKNLVQVISEEIEKEFANKVRVFASTRPNSIRSGADWQDTVLKELDKADILIIVITRSSENSMWVGFELGYFWRKTNKTRIHTLYYPNARIPNPLDTIQAKLLTDGRQVKDFFERLSSHYEREFQNIANPERIVQEANNLITDPPERSIGKFENLLVSSDWVKREIEGKEIWICQDDAIYQIIVEIEDERRFAEFKEEWTQGFPDPKSYAYTVNLKISGQTVEQKRFISLDGGRYFVPMPKIRLDESGDKRSFYLYKNSLEYKLYQIIGLYYFEWKPYEVFAQKQGIEVLDE